MKDETKAYLRAAKRHEARTAADPLKVVPKGTPYHFEVERRRSFAVGWVAGVRWMKRKEKANDQAQPRAGHENHE